MKYITIKSNGHYQVRKTIKGVKYSFGTFHSLEEAREHIKFCQMHDWDLNLRKHIQRDHKTSFIYKNTSSTGKITYTVRRVIGNRNVYFGSFNTIDEAIKYRDYLIKHNWDINYKMDKIRSRKYHNIYTMVNIDSIVYYIVAKGIKGKTTNFGLFKNIDDAVDYRDYCEENNWNLKVRLTGKLDKRSRKYIRKYKISTGEIRYSIIKKINSKEVCFGTFTSLRECKKERNILFDCCWDWDAVCEGIDESMGGNVSFCRNFKGHVFYNCNVFTVNGGRIHSKSNLK